MSFEKTKESPQEIFRPQQSLARIYERFVAHVTANERRGQAWMNALSEVDPEKYQEIHGTEADCFYDDRKIDAFRRSVFGETPTRE